MATYGNTCDPGSLPLFLDLLGPNPALARPALSVLQALLREVPDAHEGDPGSTMDACVAQWQAACAKHERIIVLDNAADEGQIRPVLAGGSVRVVVTSRRSLAGLEDVERIHRIGQPLRDEIEHTRGRLVEFRAAVGIAAHSFDEAGELEHRQRRLQHSRAHFLPTRA